jgi:probable dihydroxyacetone kinase regulator
MDHTHIASDSTKRLLTDSLKQLMLQKPLNKIAIHEITDGCGVNRQTFYYHFEDIYDQVRWMYRQDAYELLEQQKGGMVWQEALLQLLHYLDENRELCLCTLHSVAHDQLRRFFHSDIYGMIHQTIDQMAENRNLDEDQRAIMTQFYVSALSGMMESWLLDELPYSPEGLVDAIDKILTMPAHGGLRQTVPPPPHDEGRN